MKPILSTLLSGERLDRSTASLAMREMLAPETRVEQVAAALAALRVRGESAAELGGFLDVLREQAVPFPTSGEDLFDNCGTGGDQAGTFNISTAAAFVLAGGGLRVAKHGNRSASSRCGSADVLEALGIPLHLSPQESAHALARDGFTFLYAPHFHPALARLAPVRRALAVRTVFNVLGPLAHPARVRRQLVGVSDRNLLPIFAELLRDAGHLSALIVCADDGLDEVSPCAPTRFAQLNEGVISFGTVTPGAFGIATGDRQALRAGSTAEENARLLETILCGETRGTARDAVLINAAAGFVAAGRCRGFGEGMALATDTVDRGLAAMVLERARRKTP